MEYHFAAVKKRKQISRFLTNSNCLNRIAFRSSNRRYFLSFEFPTVIPADHKPGFGNTQKRHWRQRKEEDEVSAATSSAVFKTFLPRLIAAVNKEFPTIRISVQTRHFYFLGKIEERQENEATFLS